MDRKAEILESIRTLSEEDLGLPTLTLTMDTPIADVEIDSLEALKLALLLEKRWQVKFSAAEISAAQTLGDVVDLIDSRAKLARQA
jgi:acyl carrier protein